MEEVTLPPLPPLMEVVTDYGVDSLRVGVYEARARFLGDDPWKNAMLREKREAAFNRVAERIAAYAQQAASAAVLQERERAAKVVPTSWLDPLMRDMLRGGPWGCPEIEALLRRVAAAIREGA